MGAGGMSASASASSSASATQAGNSWGGFGSGSWVVNQKGSATGVAPWMLVALAGLALVLVLKK
jgi:hypothetical protein